MSDFRSKLAKVLEIPCNEEHAIHQLEDKMANAFELWLTCADKEIHRTRFPRTSNPDVQRAWFEWAIDKHFKDVAPDAVIKFLEEEKLEDLT